MLASRKSDFNKSNVGCRMSDVGCRMSDVGFLQVGCRISDFYKSDVEWHL